MKTDIQGCSTCPKGQEQYETFRMGGKKFVQYDFRDENGDLFSCVKVTLEACRIARNNWMNQRKGA